MKLQPEEHAEYEKHLENLHYKASMAETEKFLLEEKLDDFKRR